MCHRESRGRDTIRGYNIDMDLQASHRNTAAKSGAADDPQLFSSNRLFVKLSGHSGITQSTPSPVLGFDIAFTLLARWQPQGDSLRSKNAGKLKIGKVQDNESAGVVETLAHAFRWGFCDPEASRPPAERGRGIHRLGVRKMVSPQSFGAHIC